jgi:LPXTG-motif cell wall-anchored protein
VSGREGPLAHTGLDGLGGLWAGLILLVIGGSLVVLRYRRNKASAPDGA